MVHFSRIKIHLILCEWPSSIGVKEEIPVGSCSERKEWLIQIKNKKQQQQQQHDIALTMLKRVGPFEF